ncbi:MULTISPECIES: LacI family DNA-binding transcriptional regulator [Streptomyces]|uniref:LacI family transcriptional regulator n=1 Tax=Streptomyces koelreuteriae TaxID=2838015 RepID=A0ABX8FZ54_9ACTN|nr:MULTISPECIES: LacI family DNA-binding transcriptional regulator [Streptomyces]QWB26399.1 LacI family transcriptional regulator [Streptomyces koelreuteriae]UUA09479.1 LacI family transcriptional regulator [Streptomyces koelreuteriae]UUA17083.1 LacI family transcriptional regulator [Streptomyces sp. CRCS-T-1]
MWTDNQRVEPGDERPDGARRRATIHDVARLAGVSRQTVSRAVNDKGEIDPGTKERVLEAARLLDYRPSRFARGLVQKGAVTAGLVIPDLRNPFFPEVAAGVLEAAEQRGWQVVVWDSRIDDARERQALDVLSHQADAVVGYFKDSDEVLTRHLGGVPLVLLERGPQQTRFAAVGIDASAGVEQGIAHLVQSGHRRIGMLDGEHGPGARRKAFLEQVRRHGLPVDESWIVLCPEHSVAGGESGMERLLDARPEITAVFGFNDLIAVGAMRTARRRGRRVPDDLAVLGFDGLSLGELVDPALTTLHIDKRQLGRLAVEQMARLCAGEEPLRGADAWITPELVVRESA